MVTVIRIARIKTGMSLRDFAKVNGLSEVTLCKVERGKGYIPPSWRNILSEALNLPVEAICDEKGWPLLDRSQTVA